MLFYGLLLVQGVKRGWGWKVWQIAKLLMMKFGYQLFNWILLVFFFFFFQRVLHPFMLKFGYSGARLDRGSGVWLGAIVPLG